MEPEQLNTAPENNTENFSNRIVLTELKEAVTQLKQQLHKVIIGQENFIELLIVALLADGHVLIEGAPGIAKTLTAKLFAKTTNTNFQRIQFTPDLMPSDVLGTSVFNSKTADFEFKKGPIFANLVLIDEINRAPAKTQAALFEVMEEQQITIDGATYNLASPFMVLATQNPIEQEGTYALPEAQLDRFLFKIKVDYPSVEAEINILQNQHQRKTTNPISLIETILTPEKISTLKETLQEVIVEEKLFTYIANLVNNTRSHPHLYLGASPRASLAILKTAKVFAAINGRDFVTPEDIQKSLYPVLRHRIILSPEREMEGLQPENVIDMLIKSVEVPR
ncbi:MAG: AAA family ATPase [Mesonia hippocampi]|uniref:AAA family ATPase n=1 Tax=Mesonia hippocampi TaxID=1628250 RepID=UPI003F973654